MARGNAAVAMSASRPVSAVPMMSARTATQPPEWLLDLASNTCSFRTPCDSVEAGTTCCGGECLLLGTANNCLACGDTCAAGDVCCAAWLPVRSTRSTTVARAGPSVTMISPAIAGSRQCDAEDWDCGDGLICWNARTHCCGLNASIVGTARMQPPHRRPYAAIGMFDGCLVSGLHQMFWISGL